VRNTINETQDHVFICSELKDVSTINVVNSRYFLVVDHMSVGLGDFHTLQRRSALEKFTLLQFRYIKALKCLFQYVECAVVSSGIQDWPEDGNTIFIQKLDN